MAPADEGCDELIKKGVETRDPAQSLLAAMHDMQIEILGPGKILDDITDVQLREMARMMNDEIKDGQVVSLYELLKHIVTKSNMLAAHGKNNIMVMDPSLETTFWEYEMGLPKLIIGVAPWLFAPTALIAQKQLPIALVEWGEKGYFKDASTWIQKRRKLNIGLTARMASQVELGMMFGLLANAMPTTLWAIAHIWTHPELLKDLREELEMLRGWCRLTEI